jgi:hypothetical protein
MDIRRFAPDFIGHSACESSIRMLNAKRLETAAAETLREMGLLTTVFVPLDFLFSQESGVAAGAVIGITVAGVALMIGGIVIGARE